MAKTLDEAGVKRLIQEIKGANKNLNAPIPISTENTPESMAQNVKNIADYVAKAKAAGIADVNGMAVTCIINNDYSGVGYLYGDSTICGIKTNDALEAPSFFDVESGSYHENEVLVKGLSDQITSDMLVEGARKPIIITGDMTEVDEETYQKLLSGDVDVIANFGESIFIESQAKFNTGDTLNLTFGYSQFDESNDGVIATYTISINTSAPHTLTLAAIGTCEPVSKSTLTPVLQEIDLEGTDADRKAKLDKFETDWKALTGASDLTGARFVGYMDTPGYLSTMFALNSDSGLYEGVGTDGFKRIYKVQTDPSSGKIYYTPLFYHLEPVEIFDDNSIESKKKNIDNIEAYKSNLEELGVDTSISFQVPIYRKSNSGVKESGFLIYSNLPGVYKPYSGLFLQVDETSFNIFGISSTGEFIERTYYLANINYSSLTTTSKKVIDAINEVNALVKSKQDKLTSGTNIKTVNGQSLLGSGDIVISGGGGSAPVLIDIDDISGSAGVSVPVDVFNKIANAASAKTPIFGYSKLVEGPRTTYEIISLYVKNVSTPDTNGVLSIQFIAENAYNSIGIVKRSDTECSILTSSSRPFALDTSVDKSSTRGIQSSAVWKEIHSEPMTVNTAISGVTTLSSTDKHKILCYANFGTQQYNLPPSPVDGETFLFLKVKSGHEITIQSGTDNENIYDCSSGNSVVSKTIASSTKSKITVTYSSTVDKWFLMADDFIS